MVGLHAAREGQALIAVAPEGRGPRSAPAAPADDIVGQPLISYEEYHPYGTTAWWANASSTGVSQKRYRYTGKEKDDETGLYYHGARYMAPWLGRWVSADPAGMVDGPNRYQYVRGNPVGGRDPTGQFKVTPEEGADPDIDLDESVYSEQERIDEFERLEGMGRAEDVSVPEALGLHQLVGEHVEWFLDTPQAWIPRTILQNTPEPVLEAAEAAANSKAAKVLEDAALLNLLVVPVRAATVAGVTRARGALASRAASEMTEASLFEPMLVSTDLGVVESVSIESLGATASGVTSAETMAVGSLSDVVAANAEGALTTVGRWGRPGLASGDWVMVGGTTRTNYVMSGKWQPGLSNQFAPYSAGENYVVPRSTLVPPPRETLYGVPLPFGPTIKNMLGQKIYQAQP